MDMKRIMKISLFVILFLIVLLTIVFIFWGMNPTKATKDVKEFLKNSYVVKVFVSEKGDIIFEPKSGNLLVGVVFYPGGHVEHIAYAPLAYMLAQKGIKVVILKVPLSLAFLRIDGAREYIEKDTKIKWLVAGHSLGGVAACEFARKNKDLVKGIILLASYPAKDMSNFDVSVLSLLGSNDGLLSEEKWKQKKILLPAHTEYFVIRGGNHSQFGEYGLQKGDKLAKVSSNVQKEITVDKIYEFIWKNIGVPDVLQ